MCYLSLLVRTHSNERLAKPILSQEFAYIVWRHQMALWLCGGNLAHLLPTLIQAHCHCWRWRPKCKAHALPRTLYYGRGVTNWMRKCSSALSDTKHWHPSFMVSCPAVVQKLLRHIIVSSVCNLMAQLHVKHIYTPCLMGTRSGHKLQTTPSQGCPMCGLISCWMSHVCVPRLLLRIHLSFVSTLE